MKRFSDIEKAGWVGFYFGFLTCMTLFTVWLRVTT